MFPRFNWTDSRRMVSPLGSWTGVAVQWGTATLVAVILAVALGLARLQLVPLGGAYLSGIALASVVCVVVATVALWIATRRLGSIEYGMGLIEQSLD
jgi:hypothetical protein